MKLPETIKRGRKIYAIECGCKQRGGHFFSARFYENTLVMGVQNNPCKCGYFPWTVAEKNK